MANEELVDKHLIQWHPAFCSAVRLELVENKQDLTFQNEFNLSKKPLQIDLLVIEKSKDVIINNEIGKLFREHNILEYKSPDDGNTIDSYYKTIAYACLYKSSGKHIDEIKADEITISLVQKSKPLKLLKYLRDNGFLVEQRYTGIYYVIKEGCFATQIIVSSELNPELHIWLVSLTKAMQQDTARKLVLSIDTLHAKDDMMHADSVLSVAMEANPETFEDLKKDGGSMCEQLMRLMKPEFDAALNAAVKDAVNDAVKDATQKKAVDTAIRMLKRGKDTFEEIAEMTTLPLDEVMQLAKEL